MDDDKSPVKSFVYLEKSSSSKLISYVDENMKSIHGFLNGTLLLSEDVKKLALQLIQQQVLTINFFIYFLNNNQFFRHQDYGKTDGKAPKIHQHI